MDDEAAIGSAGASDRPGHPGGSPGEQSPLQTRAQFLKNRSWEFVVGLNRGACARGGAQHGFNSETQAACASQWNQKQAQVLSLEETIEFLRLNHRRAPFLFFNGNTFADVGRQIVAAVFADLATGRRRAATPTANRHAADREAIPFGAGRRLARVRVPMNGRYAEIVRVCFPNPRFGRSLQWQPETPPLTKQTGEGAARLEALPRTFLGCFLTAACESVP
jgi:hypothetical protein